MPALPAEVRASTRWIVVDDFDDCRERNLYNLAVSTFDLDARRGQRLGCFHAAHDPAHAVSIARHNLDICFAVKRPQRRQGLSNFHSESFRYSTGSSDYTLSNHIRKPGKLQQRPEFSSSLRDLRDLSVSALIKAPKHWPPRRRERRGAQRIPNWTPPRLHATNPRD